MDGLVLPAAGSFWGLRTAFCSFWTMLSSWLLYPYYISAIKKTSVIYLLWCPLLSQHIATFITTPLNVNPH